MGKLDFLRKLKELGGRAAKSSKSRLLEEEARAIMIQNYSVSIVQHYKVGFGRK